MKKENIVTTFEENIKRLKKDIEGLHLFEKIGTIIKIDINEYIIKLIKEDIEKNGEELHLSQNEDKFYDSE